MRYGAICTLMSLILISGCVRIPTEEARCKLLQTPDLDQTADIASSSSIFTSGDFPNPEWWEMFQDPKLDELIYLGLNSNPTLQKVQARVETAEEEAKIKKSRLYPTLGFSADVNWQYLGKNNFFRAYTPVIPANVPEYDIDLNFYYDFDFWGRNRNIYRAALGQAKAMEAEFANAQLVLTTSIAAVYFKLQAHMQQLKILLEEQKVLTELLTLTQGRKEHALDDQFQVLDAEERLFALSQNILLARENIDLEKHMLALLIGEGPNVQEEIETISLSISFKFPLPDHLSCDLIARRPDLIANLWRVQSMAHLVGAAQAEFYPNVDLMGFVGLSSVFANKLFTLGSGNTSVQPALHLPIFTAGRLKANLRARRAEFNQAIYAYNETILMVVKEVADQVTILKTADEELDIQNMQVGNRDQNRKLMQHRYQYALSNLLEVLDAEELFLQQEYMQIKAEYKRILSAIQLIKALGGGYCNQENPLD